MNMQISQAALDEFNSIDWSKVEPVTGPFGSEAISEGEYPSQTAESEPATAPALSVVPFRPEWPAPAAHLLGRERPAAPHLDLHGILPPALAQWVADSANEKGAPPDYVLGALLSAAGAAIGTSRWASPRHGWAEPAVLWLAIIGNPSAGKSPALDTVQGPMRKIEKARRVAAESSLKDWEEAAELAALAESCWKSAVKKAIAENEPAPNRPKEMELSPKPHVPRLIVQDSTIERLADILSEQPRGALQIRDELAGWLSGMARYSSGSDRPFWLEAYGGRSFTVERMSRQPVTVESLAVGVVGGIQPDRLNSLLFQSDDDGLLARFIPIWPEPVPIARPERRADDVLIQSVLEALYRLHISTDENGSPLRILVHFDEGAESDLDQFRRDVREMEKSAEGLLLSFLGKLPGLSVRLSLVLACLHRAAESGDAEPFSISREDYGRARDFVQTYVLPMAKRAYADAGVTIDEKAAARLLAVLREKEWRSFSQREVIRLGRAGLRKADEVTPATRLLEEGGIIRALEPEQSAQGGRPQKRWAVNPCVFSE